MDSVITDSPSSSSLRTNKKPNLPASSKVSTLPTTPTTNNNMTESTNHKPCKENINVSCETVKSLASNLESSLTLDSSNTSSLSLASSNSSNNATSSNNNNNNDASNVSDNNETANNDPSKSLSVPKFGTPVPNRVFVGGIPIDATENDVRYLFAQYGAISSVKIITDRAGVSRGYGFVTYETEEDAQKVIKEAENLIIKNRKLNVSTAVMKHQQNSYDSRVVHNGFLYQQLPYSTGANYNQYYTDNFHSLCSAEGLPIYQIAGMNGHFVSNCPSLIASPSAQYVTQTAAAAFTSPYQSPAGYIYSGVSPGAASIPIPSQHPIYHAQSQHLLSGGSLHGAHGFPYTAAAPQANANSNSPAIHTLHYPMPPNHHSSTTQSTHVNLNGSNNQPYIQFSSSTSPAINHQSMHLATTLPIHPHSHLGSIHQLNPVSEISNVAPSPAGVANLASGASNQMNAAILHHHQSHHGHPHQPSPLYTFPSNMAATHPLTPNSSQMACVQNVHLKTDPSGIELLDNVPTAVMNGPGINTSGANSSGITSLPPTVHLSNNAGYMPQVMEVVWPSSHVSNVAAYCGTTSNISNTCPPTNPNNPNNSNFKSNQNVSANRNLPVVVSVSSNLNSTSNNPNVTYLKSTNNSNQTNCHGTSSVPLASSASNNNSLTLNSTNVTNANYNSSNQSNTVSSKDKMSNSRHNNSSYGTSHKKVYNGPYNPNYSNSNSVSKSKMVNGGPPNNSNNNSRYLNSMDQTSNEHANSMYSISSTAPKQQPFAKHGYQQPPAHLTSPLVSYTGVRTNASNNNNNNNGPNNSPQAYITKTVNGVQIYVLAGEGTCIASKSCIGADNSTTSTPPQTPVGGDGTSTTSSTVYSYKA